MRTRFKMLLYFAIELHGTLNIFILPICDKLLQSAQTSECCVPFDVDMVTGEIILTDVLDRELISSYDFQIQVSAISY